MNKSKFKNSIIGLLLLINIFLLFNLVYTRTTTGNIDKLARESFAEILNKHNITFDESLVPKKYEDRQEVLLEFYNIDELRQIFLGSQAEYVSDGQSVSAAEDDKKITVSGKVFEYSTLHEKAEKDGRKILKAMKKQGLCVQGAFFDEADGLVKVKIDGSLVESVYLDISLDKDGKIAYAKGMWPKITVTESTDRVSLVQAISDIILKVPENTTIDDVKKVYSMDKKEQSSSLKPAWRLYSGDQYYTVYG